MKPVSRIRLVVACLLASVLATQSVAFADHNGNGAPSVGNAFLFTTEDTGGSVNVIEVAASDPDGDPLTVTSLAPTATNGTVSCEPSGLCTYTPRANWAGTDEFQFDVSDGQGHEATGTVNVDVQPDPSKYPTAVHDDASTDFETAVDINVLANDTDPDGDVLTIAAYDATSNGGGAVSCNATSGLCTYTPPSGFSGGDWFSYEITDGVGGAAAYVYIDVAAAMPVNTAPVATDDSAETAPGTAVDVPVLANDHDPDGDPITVTSAAPTATNGSVACTTSSCTYTPNTGWFGTDTFVYEIADDRAGTASATVTVTVTSTGAIITNGTVTLGVLPLGNLNVPGGSPSAGTGTTTVGLRYNPTNNDATSPGCECEGWGVADATSGTTGYANASSGTANVQLVSFDATASTATSVVRIGDRFEVTHDYRPSALTANIYDVTVSVKNISASATDVLYRRVMDWDIEPTAFSEYVTIGGSRPTELLYASDGGFASADPLSERQFYSFEGFAVDSGPSDHGALFDFGFGSLAAGETKTFSTFYGAAGTETEALDALRAVGTEVYSLGQSSGTDGPSLGVPNTFMFAFKGVGGQALNLPPTANPDTLTRDAGMPGSVDVLANDTDPETDVLEVASWTDGTNGTVDCTAAGVCTYTPTAGVADAEDTFTYVVRDATGNLVTGTVTVTVAAANQPPVAVDDDASTVQDTAVDVDVLTNDSDPDGDPLTVTTAAPTAASGTAACTSAGMCTYTPDPGFAGTDTFTYEISDGRGGTATAVVTVTVTATAVNQAPVAVEDSASTTVGTPVDVEVLSNDSDPDLDPIEVTSPSPAAANGTVLCTTGGLCTYTPDAGFAGTDTFTYEISDGNGGTDTATVTITVASCPEVAAALSAPTGLVTGQSWVHCSSPDANGRSTLGSPTITPVDTDLVLMTSGTVDNAAPPNDSTGISASHGNSVRNGNDVSVLEVALDVPVGASCLEFQFVFGSDEYPEFVGSSFNDGFIAELDTNDWTIDGTTSAISAPNNFAFAPDGSIVSVNSPFFSSGSVVTATGTEYDGSTPLLYARTPITPGQHKLYLSIFDAGDFILDSGVFIDGLRTTTATGAECAQGATANSSPTAADDTATTAVDVAVDINVIANDTDPDGDVLTVTEWTQGASGGTVVCTSAGSCTYTAPVSFIGSDTFSYSISDGRGGTDIAEVTVTVTANAAPVATDDALVTYELVPVTDNVLTNDTDPDGETLTVTASTQGTHGGVECTAAGDCTYTPSPGFVGTDSFTYTASDGRGGTVTGTVSVLVKPVVGISIDDSTVAEGPTDVTMTFTVSLSEASAETVTVVYGTRSVSAIPPGDYVAVAPATLTFSPGETTKPLPVTIKADTVDERDEAFDMVLTDQSPNARVVKDVGQGTITDCTVYGTEGDDVLVGTAGADVICGLGGNDILRGGGSADVLRGGAGSDTTDHSDATAAVTVNLSTQSAVSAGVTDRLVSIENATGGGYADTLSGDSGINVLVGGGGNDTLRGGSGNDALRGDGGNDVLLGQAGDDTLDGGTGRDRASYVGAAGAVSVSLAAGTASGGAGSDTLTAIEDLFGSSHGDTLIGNGAMNRIWGAGGNDTVRGGSGNDALRGDGGNDSLLGQAGNDTLDGGTGRDRASYVGAAGAVSVSLAAGTASGGAGSDTLTAIEDLFGSSHGDTLVGNGGVNLLVGGSGNDTLRGGSGNDTLRGDRGNDRMYGGAGSDRLWGGDGVDHLYGENGPDALNGGPKKDYLYGGGGSDTCDSGGTEVDYTNSCP